MDIRTILEKINIEYVEHGENKNVRYGWVGIECPLCRNASNSHFKLGIRISQPFAHCWTCGYQPLSKMLADLSNVPQSTINELVKGIVQKPIQMPSRGKLTLPKGIGDIYPVAEKYIRHRGLNPEELKVVWGLGAIARAPQYAWRIFIPIIQHGKIVSWTTRAIHPDVTPRYISAPKEHESIPAKSIIFGEDFLRHSIGICEGSFDVFKIGPGAVATLGVSVTKEQILRIAKYPRRFIIFDNEFIAQQRARKLARELSVFPGKTSIITLDAKDPGSAKPREIQLIRKLLK